jgi:TetR/AcrR family transcriptional regulator
MRQYTRRAVVKALATSSKSSAVRIVRNGKASRDRDRRRTILEAATELFAERGYAGVSFPDIASAAGTHKTTIRYHFGSKDDLYIAVLDEALEKIAQVMGDFLSAGFESTNLRERVAYLLDQVQAYYAERPSHARLLERELLEAQVPDIYLDHFVERIYQPAVAGLEEAAARGIIRAIDPALFIHDVHVLLVGYFCHRPLLERLKPGDPFSIEALIARRNHLIDQMFALFQFAPDGVPS